MCRKWLPSFIDISFLLQGVEMCVFLIPNVVMVTGLLGCCFLHPTKAAGLGVWVQFEAGDGGDQPDHPAHLRLGTAKPGARDSSVWVSVPGGGMEIMRSRSYHSYKCLLGNAREISTHSPSTSSLEYFSVRYFFTWWFD